MKSLRQQNGVMNQERKERERLIKALDHSQDREGAAAPKNVNLLPFVDDVRIKMRREYEERLKKENKNLKIEKEQYQDYKIQQKNEERKKQQQFQKIANDMEKSIKIKNVN